MDVQISIHTYDIYSRTVLNAGVIHLTEEDLSNEPTLRKKILERIEDSIDRDQLSIGLDIGVDKEQES